MKAISILIFLLVLCTSIGNCQQIQFVRFWNSSNCVGNHTWELRNATNSFNIPAPAKSSLGHIVNGLWSISTCSGSLCGNATLRPTSGCNNFNIPSNTVSIDVTRYGDANQVEAKIHLFSLGGFQGDVTVVENNINFPSPRNFSSYYFTGKHSWELLNESMNRINCLNHTITGPNNYGIRYATTVSLRNVKTIVYGCGNPAPGSGNAVETSLKTIFLGFLALLYIKV